MNTSHAPLCFYLVLATIILRAESFPLVVMPVGRCAFTGGATGHTPTSKKSTVYTGCVRVALQMRAFEKKGKSNIPPRLRHDYNHERNMREERNEKIEPRSPGADGLPVLNLFVREKRREMWHSCGSIKCDEASASLVASYRDDRNEASKEQLDAVVSRGLAEDFIDLENDIFSVYPQLRKKPDELEFGYKIACVNLSDKQKGMTIVARDSA